LSRRICLVGCGNVGSRHLQAIAKLPFEVEIDIVEPNLESMLLGKKRLEEIDYNNETHKFSWYKNIEELQGNSELTIIATTVVGRVDLLLNLAERGHRRFLVEKIVCQSDNDYERLMKKINEFNVKGWVNTNRRYFESYKKLKEYFKESKNIHFSVTTSNLSALATSSIHFIDLFSYFVGDYNINLNGEFLLNEIFPNKRGNNFVEFAGTIIGSIKNGSTFSMTSLPATKLPTIINIIGNDKHIMINETNEELLDLINPENNNFDYRYENVSGLTDKIIQDILENDTCDLTTLEDSQILHKEIFKIFNSHIKKMTNKEMEFCPIT
jgi:hypothetical protein